MTLMQRLMTGLVEEDSHETRNVALAAVASGVAGAALMYLFDPKGGRRRRALLTDKVVHASHEVVDAVGPTARDVAHRSQGMFASLFSWPRKEEAGDDVIEARVRSKLGHVCSHPGAVEVHSSHGVVTLRGHILEHEAQRTVNAVRKVRGVVRVNSALQGHSEPGRIPDLQGGVERTGRRFELLQTNWSPAARLATGVGGGAAMAYGVSRGGPVGWMISGAGFVLALRGITNMELQRLFGLGGRPAVDIVKTLHVRAPVDDVFRFWRAPENFPRFMSHLRSVRKIGDGRYLWEVDGPAGTIFGWEGQVTQVVPNEIFAWKSITGSVKNAGVVHFDEEGPNLTRVHIRMSYNPPAGAVGHLFAKILGADPKKQMDDDLLRFKSLLEQGKATAHHHTVTRDEIQPSK